MSEPIPLDAVEARRTFELTAQCVLLSLLELKPANATARISVVTNPIIWEVGHLANQQDRFLHRTDGGRGLLPDTWQSFFGGGSDPSKNMPDYPSFAEVVDGYIVITLATRAMLADVGASAWSRPRTQPDGKLLIRGETLLVLVRRIATHHIYHVGCITAIRKELGDKGPIGFIPGMSPEMLTRQQEMWDKFWKTHRDRYL